MPNTPNYGIPYPSGSDQVEGTFIQKIADAANSFVNLSGDLTSKGDVLFRSTAITRLPVGTSGSYLETSGTADANRMSWSGSFSGTYSNALELIGSVTVGTAAGSYANISFTSIPSTYSMLILRGVYKSQLSAPIDMRINGNAGSVYKTSYNVFNNASTAVYIGATGTFTSGTATRWTFAQGNKAPQYNSSIDTSGTRVLGWREATSLDRDDRAFVEVYFPEYAGTAGTFKNAYATSSRGAFAIKPDSLGRNGTRAHMRFSSNIYKNIEDTGRPFFAHITGTGQAGIDVNQGTQVTMYPTIPLNDGHNDDPNQSWYSTQGTATFTRTATGGTTTIAFNTLSRPGIAVGDTFIIANNTHAITGINGTWVATGGITTAQSTALSTLTYVSGIDGTVGGSAFSEFAELRMTRSVWFYNGTLANNISPVAAPATAHVSVGGSFSSIKTISALRYSEGNTAISSISLQASPVGGAIFELYGVK